MWDMVILGVSLVSSGVCIPILVEVGAFIVIAVQGSRWAGTDSSRDMMVSW